ncbi:hypothetical protein B7486_00795 [cyanobacterium TDX16]|nr:hypothetical protein B7486_00795 [cyanobacterium TDX16]
MDEENVTIGETGKCAATTAEFPSPEDVHVFVRRNNDELRALFRSVLRTKADDVLPQAYWNWFRESRLPAVLFVRYWFIGLLTAFVLLLAATAYGLASNPRTFPNWGQFGILGIQIVMFVIPALSGRRVRLHFAGHLAENAGLVCPNCGYIIRGLPQAHTCPECGRAYTFANVHRYWYRWMSNHMHLNLTCDNAADSPN